MGMLLYCGIRTLPCLACLIHVLAVLGFFLPFHALAQDGSSALNGVVEDVTGARVASAAVTIANPENGFHREVVADAVGNFSFGMLPPGRARRCRSSKKPGTP